MYKPGKNRRALLGGKGCMSTENSASLSPDMAPRLKGHSLKTSILGFQISNFKC